MSDSCPRLAAALRPLLPTAGQTLLLRAALDAHNGAAAWAAWRAVHPLPETLADDHAGIKALLPLLAYALEQNGAALASGDRSLLRMARFREALRSERYQRVMQQVISFLAGAGVKAILLKGAALAHTVYPQPELRHSHDLDLLVQPRDLPWAATTLLAHNFHQNAGEAAPDVGHEGSDRHLVHASALPLELHTRLFRNEFYAGPIAHAWENASRWGDGLAIELLAPEWQLIHILGTKLCAAKRAQVTWVCDALLLIGATPAMNWATVCVIARDCRLSLAVYVLLEYLQQQHDASIPLFVFERLRQQSAEAGRAENEQILQNARSHKGAGYRGLLAAASGWSERSYLLRWMLFPLPLIPQWSGQLPAFYLQRGLRYLRRKMISNHNPGHNPGHNRER